MTHGHPSQHLFAELVCHSLWLRTGPRAHRIEHLLSSAVLPSAILSLSCRFHLARVVILHTSQLGYFGKCVITLCSLLVWSSWALFVLARLFFQKGFLLNLFCWRRWSNQRCTVVYHLLREQLEQFLHCFLRFFSGTRFPCARACSLGIVSKDGVVDCFVTATKGYDIFDATFNGFLCFC